VTYLYFLLEDSDKLAPDAEYAALFASETGITNAPVLADPDKGIAAATGLDPKVVPGKCVLSPTMEILGCYVGADDRPAVDILLAHAR
jgi:hypothetical protein